MLGLLGKISGVEDVARGEAGERKVKITCSPLCLMPTYAPVPEWLRTAEVQVLRTVAGRWEVGQPGDSLILTAQESADWLRPFRLFPAINYGQLPDALQLTLRCWPGESPAPFSVQAADRQYSGVWQRQGELYHAAIPTASLLPSHVSLPLTITACCGPFSDTAILAPEVGTPFSLRMCSPSGDEVYRAENAWYRLDITLHYACGGISSLIEQGRQIDHFRMPTDLLQYPMEFAGHADRIWTGWKPLETINSACIQNIGKRQAEEGLSLLLAGEIDKEQGIHSTLICTLHERLPLITWERTVLFDACPADGTLHNPLAQIDKVRSFGMGFRAAWEIEQAAITGSRLLGESSGQLVVVRATSLNESIEGAGWQMDGGWLLIQHPRRQQCLLYLSDRLYATEVTGSFGPIALSLEVRWPMLPIHPGAAGTMLLGLVAGEVCGADTDGVWVGVRTPLPTGGVCCTVLGRLREQEKPAQACFKLGESEQHVPLQRMLLPSVGTMSYATATFPHGTMTQSFAAAMAGIASRR